MRLLQLEMKRVLKTRMTWMLLGVACVLAVVMAYLPVTFETVLADDGAGGKRRLSGMEAVAYYRGYNDSLYGEVTPELVRDAARIYQEVYREYGSVYGENVPEEVYYRRLALYSPYIRGLKEVFANRDTGMAPAVTDINLEECGEYYGALSETPLHPSLRLIFRQKHPNLINVRSTYAS